MRQPIRELEPCALSVSLAQMDLIQRAHAGCSRSAVVLEAAGIRLQPDPVEEETFVLFGVVEHRGIVYADFKAALPDLIPAPSWAEGQAAERALAKARGDAIVGDEEWQELEAAASDLARFLTFQELNWVNDSASGDAELMELADRALDAAGFQVCFLDDEEAQAPGVVLVCVDELATGKSWIVDGKHRWLRGRGELPPEDPYWLPALH